MFRDAPEWNGIDVVPPKHLPMVIESGVDAGSRSLVDGSSYEIHRPKSLESGEGICVGFMVGGRLPSQALLDTSAVRQLAPLRSHQEQKTVHEPSSKWTPRLLPIAEVVGAADPNREEIMDEIVGVRGIHVLQRVGVAGEWLEIQARHVPRDFRFAFGAPAQLEEDPGSVGGGEISPPTITQSIFR